MRALLCPESPRQWRRVNIASNNVIFHPQRLTPPMPRLSKTRPRRFQRRVRHLAITIGLAMGFLALAIWSVWPAPTRSWQALPAGPSACGTVPMLNAWTIWWNSDRLARGLDDYWDTPIFHPERGTLAYSEPQPATWLVAPVVWATGSPVPAYHCYLITMLTLNGLFAVRLLRTLRVHWVPAVAGGVATLLHPLAHLQMDVVQLLPLWGVLWTLDVLLKLHRRPGWRRGGECGVAVAVVFFSCVHHGLFFVLLLAATAWLTLPARRWRRWLAAVAVAVVTATVVLLPLLWPMRQILQQQGFDRRPATVESLSARPADWLRLPSNALLSARADSHKSRQTLSPGWFRIALAVAGSVACLRRRRRRQATLFLVALAATGVIWSFGMNLQLGPWRPWETLCAGIPGFQQVRSAYRFAYFVQLVVILLAAVGFESIWRLSCPWASGKVLRITRFGVLLAAGALVAFEIPPARVRLVDVPDVSQDQSWQVYLRDRSTPGRAVVCLPFAAGYEMGELEDATRWMLLGTRHGRPLVNGYSGFFPESWFELMATIGDEPFGKATLERLSAADVEFLVIQTNRHARPATSPDGDSSFILKRVFRDPSGIEIWRLEESLPDAAVRK